MRARYELLELESKYESLQQQVISLTAAHDQLTARERLLAAWCGALRLLREHAGCQSDSLQDTAGSSELDLHLLLSAADTSTSTVSAEPSSPHDTRSRKWFKNNDSGVRVNSRELLFSDGGVYATIAPAADPAAFLRRLLVQPLLPDADSITADDLAQLLREVTLEACMQHHLLGVVQGPADQAAVLDKLEAVWARYFRATVSLFLCGRMHVVESMATYNLEHLAVDPAGAAAHESVIQAHVLTELTFTPQQQQAIAVGGQLFRARMRAITAAQQDIQGSLGAAPCGAAAGAAGAGAAGAGTAAGGDEGNSGGAAESCWPARTASGSNDVGGLASGATCNNPLSGAAAAAAGAASKGPQGAACGDESLSGASSGVSSGRSNSSSSGAGVSQLDTLTGRLRELDALSHHTTQVERLLGERGQLRLITCVWLVGCLSWPQWTRFAMLCWPYCHRPAVLAETLMKLQQQQQQQQQGVAGCVGAVPGSPQL